jgi:hypothetical protein
MEEGSVIPVRHLASRLPYEGPREEELGSGRGRFVVGIRQGAVSHLCSVVRAVLGGSRSRREVKWTNMETRG